MTAVFGVFKQKVQKSRHLTYPFISKYVDEEAVSTAQVHKRLSGCQAFLCTLLSPQHLKYSRRDSALNPVGRNQVTSAARHLLLSTPFIASDTNWFYRVRAVFHSHIDWPSFGCKTRHVRSENEFHPQVHIYRHLCIHSSGGAGFRCKNACTARFELTSRYVAMATSS